MRKRLYSVGIVVLGVMVVLLFANCQGGGPSPIPGKVTGGGTIAKAGGGMASFGFAASNCDSPSEPSGRFTYIDPSATQFDGGVKLSGSIIDAQQCMDPAGCFDSSISADRCPQNGYLIKVGYKSLNPKYPGSGIAGACVVDRGQGKNGQGDLLGLGVESGPYGPPPCSPPGTPGYQAQGDVRGNIQGHACK